MNEPEYLLEAGVRIRTHAKISDTGGMLIAQAHLDRRKAGAVGAIGGIVGGHGGDVYYVAHVGDTRMAAYGFWEFELEPAKDPCPDCKGSGIDWKTSHATKLCTACPACEGTAEKTIRPEPVSVYEHLQRNVQEIK